MSLSRFFVFLAVIIALTAAIHYLLWARLVRDSALPAPWGRILTVAIIALAVLLPLSLLAMRAPRAIAAPVAWVGFTWLGLMFLLFVALLPAEVVRAIALRAFASGKDAVSSERRVFVARALAAAVGTLALGSGAFGVVNALRTLRERRVRVRLAKLPPALSGYRIVQITDIHVGPTIGRAFMEALVARVNALAPDLVAITGDLVDGTVGELAAHVAPLRDLRAKDGVFFVTGNHEYYSGVDEWISHLRGMGIVVLRNERIAIRGEAGFDLAGVDDAHARQYGLGHGMDVSRALGGRDASRACVLLAHQPKAIGEASAHGACLQISGHTHAGQIFPFTWLVALDQPFVRGLHAVGDTQIYVSEGTGYWGPPMRLGTWAEITALELVSASA